jgi:hypothetical protein
MPGHDAHNREAHRRQKREILRMSAMCVNNLDSPERAPQI